jgi:carboxymethylenebutenolidase
MKIVLPLIISLFLGIEIDAQDFALKQLENSPRHHEWITVPSGQRNVNCFVAYPEVSTKSTVVIIIHENMGLNDWARSFADQVAAAGYIAIAPDLLSDFATGKSKTSEFANSDEARNAIYTLKPDQVTNDLNAVAKYAAGIPAGNGFTAVIGFCWGGGQCFRFATNNSGIKAALVFYGSAPETKTEMEKISAPVYGFYGGNDVRINATIPATDSLMNAAGKKYEFQIYEGAGHGFMRQGDDPGGSAENKKAREEAFNRVVKILKGI